MYVRKPTAGLTWGRRAKPGGEPGMFVIAKDQVKGHRNPGRDGF
jgi:hypothetical protein